MSRDVRNSQPPPSVYCGDLQTFLPALEGGAHVNFRDGAPENLVVGPTLHRGPTAACYGGRGVLALLPDLHDGYRQAAVHSRDGGDDLQHGRHRGQGRVGGRVLHPG